MSEKPRALGMVRLPVGSENQTGEETQRTRISKRADAEDMELVDIDVSASISPWMRPSLGDWFNNKKDQFDHIIILKIDRIARSVRHLSDSGDETFDCKHHVVIVQHGNRLTAQSLPGASTNPDSPLSLDLTVDRNVVTGAWTEQTAADGYYQGARYHGAIQLLIEPTGRRMAGKWVGFGKDFDVNTGPWELRLLDRSTRRASIERYSTLPD